MWVNPLLASLAAASVLGHGLTTVNFQRGQLSLVALWTLITLGHTFPDQSGKILSLMRIWTMLRADAWRSSGTARCQCICSCRTPRPGTLRFPLTYGTCSQDFVFNAAGRLMTMRPLPFLGSGKGLNFGAMRSKRAGHEMHEGKQRNGCRRNTHHVQNAVRASYHDLHFPTQYGVLCLQ